MIVNNDLLAAVEAPVRQIATTVELYNGSTKVADYKHTDALVSVTIERIGTSKFFGFGVCQKANVKLRDVNRAIDITTANSFKIYFNDVITCPVFYVSEVHRNEKTNELSITAYDALYKASAHTFDELNLITPYTVGDVAFACCRILGLSSYSRPVASAWNVSYENGANFGGKESIREALDAIAEATQTIYYMDASNRLTFKRLDMAPGAVFTIDKDKYIELDSGTNRRLSGITHATELGDNVSASLEVSGTVQYVRDNPFWDLREDIGDLVNNALAAVGGMTINQFTCSWRGNPLLEIGDKIALVTRDNETVFSYLLDDTITYDGSLSQESRWSYEDDEGEDADNPASLGEFLKRTVAKVDKVNQEISLAVSSTTEALDSINGELEEINKRVSATVNKDEVEILISETISNGVDSVQTTKGFTFNDEGLTIAQSDSDISTIISEDGMTVKKGDDDVLTANNEGVKAIDLHATTYLIVGDYSRFENYGTQARTACYWIGK